ncbi:hypothetical protein BXT86_04255 [candidate division WOR-3 bacterium 4484_100]|uniref:Uncharacterized protein n=1 Tax=candidate division WOR-3 bacterium 4484_100 TaxID=1936077 RepID=A0A1V4QFT8_UNCW3|nr:MAG: hypothetical protein BXT86_04255 [candidate division WOR-3 bacterium 4484_100]
MNLLLIISIFCGVDLYFLKDSPNLLVRILPKLETKEVVLYYSFYDTTWDSIPVEPKGKFFDAVLTPKDTLNILGLYFRCDSIFDDNQGELYLYEIRLFPKMILPFTFTDLEKMIGQATNKIVSGQHKDEGITLLEYVSRVLKIMPVMKNSEGDLKKRVLEMKIEKLKQIRE